MDNDDILESVLAVIETIEDILTEIKTNITEYSALDENERKDYDFSFEKVMDLRNEFQSLKRSLKHVFKGNKRQYGRHYRRHNDLGFSFDFSGLENLGETIERTVKSALSGLDNLEGIFDFDFDPHGYSTGGRRRKSRRKVDPGLDIIFSADDSLEEPEGFPDISGIHKSNEILKQLEKGILTHEQVANNLQLSQDEIAESLSTLKDMGFILQEKAGNHRYMLTRRGKKFLSMNENKTEDTNN